MKKFVVMVNYVFDGWKIHAETDSFEEAVAKREECLSISKYVSIFKPVELVITEKDTENKYMVIKEVRRYIERNNIHKY